MAFGAALPDRCDRQPAHFNYYACRKKWTPPYLSPKNRGFHARRARLLLRPTQPSSSAERSAEGLAWPNSSYGNFEKIGSGRPEGELGHSVEKVEEGYQPFSVYASRATLPTKKGVKERAPGSSWGSGLRQGATQL